MDVIKAAFRNKALNALGYILSFVPFSLPESYEAHQIWASEIIRLGRFPDNPSFRHAIASQLLHLDTRVVRKSKQFFVYNLRRSIANQTAYGIIQETKTSEKTVATIG